MNYQMNFASKPKIKGRGYLSKKTLQFFSTLAITAGLCAPLSISAQESQITPAERANSVRQSLSKRENSINRFEAPPMLSYYPSHMKTDGKRYMQQRMRQIREDQATGQRRNNKGGGGASGIKIKENEPVNKPGRNDSQDTGQKIKNFGSGPEMTNRVYISGATGPEAELTFFDQTASEDDGAIPISNGTGIKERSTTVVTYNEVIGDGPRGSAGTGTGDLDFYAFSAQAGQKITIDINTADPFGDLDSYIELYAEDGTFLGAFDDDGFSFDSFVEFTAPFDGNFFFSVAGWGAFGLLDPFDPDSPTLGSLFGFPPPGSEGAYEMIITSVTPDEDVDFYVFDLKKGDLFGADIDNDLGLAPVLSVRRPTQDEAVGTDLPSNIFYPVENPLPKMGATSIAYIAEEDGKYAIAVSNNIGSYKMELFATRSKFEVDRRMTQILFLDFNGSEFDAGEFFGGPPSGTVQLSPFRDFLENWGIKNTNKNVKRITRRITNVVRENLERDLIRQGINPNFNIKILANDGRVNDKWEPTSSESRPVSKVIIGGTIEESGIGTIGIAQSIDLGNYDPEEVALVLLDVLSAPASGENANGTFSINDLELAEGVTIEDAIVTAIGNVTAHEAGHYLGNWHNDGFNETSVIMDEGPGGFFNLAGVGPSGVFGAADKIDVDLKGDFYSTGELFTGFENNAVNTAYALSFVMRNNRIKGVDSEEAESDPIPNALLLSESYPNPIRKGQRSAIGFTVPERSKVKIQVFDLAGNKVGTLFRGKVEAGEIHKVTLDSDELNLREGVYFYKLESDQGTRFGKVSVN